MKNKKIVILVIVFSIICGILSHDYFFGTAIVICGTLNAYFVSIGKKVNYIFGALYCALASYSCFINGLYGTAVLSLLVYVPSQIYGYICWQKYENKEGYVSSKKFTLVKSIIVVLTCIFGSFLIGEILTKIPGQQLAFLDSSSDILNLCGIVLMNLRYREFLIICLLINIFDSVIWEINFVAGSPNATMMFIVSLAYLIINIFGFVKWYKKSKNDFEPTWLN